MTLEMLTARVEPGLRQALDHEADKRGLSRSELIREALLQVVDEEVLEEAADRALLATIDRRMQAEDEAVRAALGINIATKPGEPPTWMAHAAADGCDGGDAGLAAEVSRLAQDRVRRAR